MDDFEAWVNRRITTGAPEPFCPFDGPEKIGYCDVAYSKHCYTCDEAKGEWETVKPLLLERSKRKQTEPVKPCPWCGEANKNQIIRQGLSGQYFVHHLDAVFNIQSSVGFDTEAEAVAAWNKMGVHHGEAEKLH